MMSKDTRRRSTMESILTQGSQDLISQWELIMRRFSEDTKRLNANCRRNENELAAIRQKAKKSGDPLPTTITSEFPKEKRPPRHFVTGSTYDGTWDAFGMCGHGVYTFPNGTIYEGDFKDGEFHGHGVLKFSSGIKVIGTWFHGSMQHRTVVFEDGVTYDENDWPYCNDEDRRFAREHETGLVAAGVHNSTLTAKLPSFELPDNCYDTSDGYYDPKTYKVYSYVDSNIVRCSGPKEKEHDWIVNHCRSQQDPTGPQPRLFVDQPDPKPEMPTVPTSPEVSTLQGSSASIETNHSRRDIWTRLLMKKHPDTISKGWSKKVIQFNPSSQM